MRGMVIWGPLKTLVPSQIGSCGGEYYRSVGLSCEGVASVDAKPQVQHIIKVYHHESGT